MSIINAIARNNKTSFKQYFCNADKGMRLRSGTVINCIENSRIYIDLADLYENLPLSPLHDAENGVYDFAQWNCHQCFYIINQLRFIERHHETLRSEPQLLGILKETLSTLNDWIDGIERGEMKCGCWHYHSWRVTEGACMLTPEYEYLSSLDRTEYHDSLKNKENNPTHPFFYSARTLHRLFHNNFLVPTEEVDTEDLPVKKHDFNLILGELKIWQRYFRRESPKTINAARKTLSKTRIVPDCVGNILEFL